MKSITDENTVKMESSRITPEQNYTKLVYRVLSYLLFLLEKHDQNHAMNLLDNLVNPPFNDFGDLMNKVQENVKGWFSSDIVSCVAFDVNSKDFTKDDFPRIQKFTKPKEVEPTTRLRSLRPHERPQQSNKGKNEKRFKSEDGEKPKSSQEDTPDCSEISDTLKVSLDCGTSYILLANSKLSSTKAGFALSQKSNSQKSEIPKGKTNIQSSQLVETIDHGLGRKRAWVLSDVEPSHSEDKPVRPSQEGEPNSVQPSVLQKNINSKSEEVYSSNYFVTDEEPKMTADAASGFAKSGKVAPVNHKLLDRWHAVDQKSKNTALETATNKSTTKAVKLLRTVKNRSLKTDIWESTPHVTKLKPKPKDKREVPTKVIGSKDELISMSSTPEKCDTESTALNAEKTFSDSKAPISLSKELYANKVEEVQTNIQNKQMILYYQKTKLQIDTLIKLCDGLKSDLTVAQTSQKCDSILIGSSSELGNNSKNFGLLKAEQSIDAESKELKPVEKDCKEDCGKFQFSVKETKLPASKDASSEVPTSIFMDSNVAENEDKHSTNHELNVRNFSKTKTTRSENNSQNFILSDCNNIKGNTPALRAFNRREKSAEVSDIQDFQQTGKPPSKRMKDDKDELSEMLRVDEFQLTPNYSPAAPASQGFWYVQLKDDRENHKKEA